MSCVEWHTYLRVNKVFKSKVGSAKAFRNISKHFLIFSPNFLKKIFFVLALIGIDHAIILFLRVKAHHTMDFLWVACFPLPQYWANWESRAKSSKSMRALYKLRCFLKQIYCVGPWLKSMVECQMALQLSTTQPACFENALNLCHLKIMVTWFFHRRRHIDCILPTQVFPHIIGDPQPATSLHSLLLHPTVKIIFWWTFLSCIIQNGNCF